MLSYSWYHSLLRLLTAVLLPFVYCKNVRYSCSAASDLGLELVGSLN
jgi:hypothetical protein